jgi:hypothetical protein
VSYDKISIEFMGKEMPFVNSPPYYEELPASLVAILGQEVLFEFPSPSDEQDDPATVTKFKVRLANGNAIEPRWIRFDLDF